jgi:hypothetical protein
VATGGAGRGRQARLRLGQRRGFLLRHGVALHHVALQPLVGLQAEQDQQPQGHDDGDQRSQPVSRTGSGGRSGASVAEGESADMGGGGNA